MATTTSVSCPECGAVLRPAKPLRVGKTVKCPKCDAGFVIGAEEERRPAPAATAKPAAPAPKKPAGSPAPKKPAGGSAPVAPIMPANDDDDDYGGGGTYAVTTEDKGDGAEVDYAPDMGIRDLRGPAMQAIVDPSNQLIFTGAMGFFGWLAFLVILLIPLLFPLSTKAERDKAREMKEKAAKMAAMTAPKGQPQEPVKKDDDDSSILKIGGLDLRDIAELHWALIILCLMPQVIGLIYSGTLAMGAVKVQNLESREWGVAASVMAMVPLNVGGLMCGMAMVLNLALDLLFDEPFKWFVLGFFLVCVWGLSLACGIWMLTVLNKPEVIAGFEYVAE
jgi:endogenous inhibitor of DNA gyrase (YacG/DUF329 family)